MEKTVSATDILPEKTVFERASTMQEMFKMLFFVLKFGKKKVLSGQLQLVLKFLKFLKMQFLNILYVEVNDDGGGGNISCRKFNFQQENTLKRQTKLKTLFLVMQLKVQVF